MSKVIDDRRGPTGGNAKLRVRLAEERESVLALERYRDALETWLMLMELERDAKRFRWEAEG